MAVLRVTLDEAAADLSRRRGDDVGRARRPVTGDGDLVVVLTCEWCGREVRVAAGPNGPEIENAAEFLETHRDCLARRPRQ